MTGLALYRGLTGLGAPLINVYLHRRMARGKEHPDRFSERMGIASQPRPNSPLVWVHAASVGEAQSALALIDGILHLRTDVFVLITTGTVTSAKMLSGRLPPRSFHQFVPVDRLPWVRRFLDYWDPDLALWIESEFWPNLITETADRNIPLALVNGRISRKSFSNWRHMPAFIRNIVGRFQLCLAQTDDEAERFRTLGARRVDCVGNLKFSAAPLPFEEPELVELCAAVGGRPRWLAANTHRGEETLVIETHAVCRQTHKDALNILVPRHPERGGEIRSLLEAAGMRVSQRSKGEPIDETIDVYLADTLGELGLFYRLSDIVFIGGTIAYGGGASHGGHNPMEAAQLNCAILHGPDMTNQEMTAMALARARAVRTITDAETLARSVLALWQNPAEANALAAAARAVADDRSNAVDKVLEALSPFLEAIPHGQDYAAP